MDDSNVLSALQPGELETIIAGAVPSNLKKLGSPRWIEWHESFQKLQQQAVLESTSYQAEVTKDAIISSGKIPLLIYEAICISVWRTKVLPKLLEAEWSTLCSFLLYAILYHENVAVGLLEIVCYDEEACVSIHEILIDLIDYCIEMITGLVFLINDGYLDEKPVSKDERAEFERQRNDLLFDTGFRCVTIISCLTNILDKVHISASARLYVTHDTPLLMVELLQLEPWRRRNDKGDVQLFMDGKWKGVNDEDSEKMTRHETMIWLCLWRLVVNPDLGNHYEMNNFKKTQLCKILYKITEVQMDQVPVLIDLKRSLGQLSVSDVSCISKGGKKPLFIEVIPQIKPQIVKKFEDKKSSIMKAQLNYFNPANEDLVEMAKRLSMSYTSDVMEVMDSGSPKCGNCDEKAAKKCSRCKSEWYCGRECQVKHWSKHKKACDQIVSLN